ncbi:MAG: sulfotransferase [Steroidobacteraceae bacterium]
MAEPVLVLGMHRSGTSFLIRALNLAGLWLGADSELGTVEGRAGRGNPKGNYEHREGIAINDAILRRSGGSWFDPPRRLLAGAEDAQRIRAFCGRLEDGCPPYCLRWGWKDPRTLLTLEVWLRALPRSAMIIGSFRHPAAVARSLLERDRLPLERGYALWAHYNSMLIGCLERLPHALVRFDVEQGELIAQVARACDLAGLKWDPYAIASWYDPALVRSRTEPDEQLPPALRSAWERLLALHRLQH